MIFSDALNRHLITWGLKHTWLFLFTWNRAKSIFEKSQKPIRWINDSFQVFLYILIDCCGRQWIPVILHLMNKFHQHVFLILEWELTTTKIIPYLKAIYSLKRCTCIPRLKCSIRWISSNLRKEMVLWRSSEVVGLGVYSFHYAWNSYTDS